MPESAAGNTTRRLVCIRLAPSAAEPCRMAVRNRGHGVLAQRGDGGHDHHAHHQTGGQHAERPGRQVQPVPAARRSGRTPARTNRRRRSGRRPGSPGSASGPRAAWGGRTPRARSPRRARAGRRSSRRSRSSKWSRSPAGRPRRTRRRTEAPTVSRTRSRRSRPGRKNSTAGTSSAITIPTVMAIVSHAASRSTIFATASPGRRTRRRLSDAGR